MKQYKCPKDIGSFQLLKEDDFFMVGEYQIWDKSIYHSSSNQVLKTFQEQKEGIFER